MVTKKEIELVSDDELESEPEPAFAPAKIQHKVNFFFIFRGKFSKPQSKNFFVLLSVKRSKTKG